MHGEHLGFQQCVAYFINCLRYHPHPKFLPFPAKHVAIRGAQEEKYAVVDITKVGQAGGSARILEEIEISRALFEIYEGAVVRRSAPQMDHIGLTLWISLYTKD